MRNLKLNEKTTTQPAQFPNMSAWVYNEAVKKGIIHHIEVSGDKTAIVNTWTDFNFEMND